MEVPSQLKTFELYQKSESETLEIFICLSWQLAVKVKGSTYCHWDEKFRNQQWKCELWAHSRWTTWIYLPTSCGFYQGDLGDVGLDLHLSWHAGDHHWNHILSCLVLFYLHHSPFFSCLALIKNFGPSRSKHTTKLREHLPKKNVFFRALPEWGGGEALARITRYNIYIYLWRPKKMYKLPERGGGRGNSGNARKKTFFFSGGVP